LTQILSHRSNAPIGDPGPPPDGGLKAWTQAIMGHLVIFNTWGMISAFSVFQAYYTTELGLEPSAVSWIGSMQMFGHFFLGMLSGRALDGGLFYWVVWPGVLLVSLSMFMTSLCHEYWQFFLAQGIMYGLGSGLQFAPATGLVYTYFSSNKVVAIAIMAAGSGTGGLVYPTILRQLLPKLGFAWTTRICAFLMLAVGSVYCSLLKPPPYTLYVVGIFLACLGQFFSFFYIGSYALDVVGVSYSTSVNILMLMNGVGVLGRIVPGFIADQYFGGMNVMIPFVFASAIVLYCWTAVKSTVGLYIFAAVYGFASAGFQGLFPSNLGSLTKDLSKVGTRSGMGFSFAGVAVLVGPPVAGALVQNRGYVAAQVWAASMIALGGVVLVLARLKLTGLVVRVR
ncbi:MFS general substrate transporter, partial [Sporormia fimetaria CBS 119925]